MNIKKGFTLIELLVVVSIISMLTSIVLSSINDAKSKGRDAGKIRALIEIRNALQLYATDKGGFPQTTTVAGLTTELVNGSKKYIPSINTNIKYQGTILTNTAVCSSGSTCPSYHLGIPLERTDNRATASDQDNTQGFDGASTDCAGTAGTDRCYDVLP